MGLLGPEGAFFGMKGYHWDSGLLGALGTQTSLLGSPQTYESLNELL